MSIIKNHKGQIIQNLDDWKCIYSTGQREKHWKEGRSAYAIADFVINHNGLYHIRSRIEEIIHQDIGFLETIPEFEIRFDKFGRGRVHDLAIRGETESNQNVFVGVEAKVDESFGPTISEVYLDAKARDISGDRTRVPQRIDQLLKKQFKKIDRSAFDLRYQLLYSVAGTIAAKSDISVLYIIVFRTNLYDDLIGAENYKDYLTFLNAVAAIEQDSSRPGSRVYNFKLGRKELLSIYEQVDLK